MPALIELPGRVESISKRTADILINIQYSILITLNIAAIFMK